MTEQFVVDNLNNKERIDVFLSQITGKTRSHFSHLIENGCVKITDRTVEKSGEKVKAGDVITIDEPEAVEVVEKKDIPIDIIYQDDDIAIINKPQGLTVHPGAGNYDNTLVNGLMYHLSSLSGINGEIRPGIVHRLDKDTSGIMMVAKNDDAHVSLSAQIENREVRKIYVGIVEGVVKQDQGEIVTNVGRDPKDRKRMTVTQSGRKAITRYTVLERYKNNTLVAFHILTGRTHQIRVHSKYIGHPIVGDDVYGYKKQRFETDGQMLHAFALTFTHPTKNEEMTFTATPNDRFLHIIDVLSAESGINRFDFNNLTVKTKDIY